MALDTLTTALAPIFDVLQDADPSDPALAARLNEALPVDGDECTVVRAAAEAGVGEGWLCDREAGGVKFSRVSKDAHGLSIDAVHMSAPGPGHEHPNGEIDLCFAVDGQPTFDGQAPGWTVYPPGSWHVPTVSGGVMDILYFLPGGAIRFGPPAT